MIIDTNSSCLGKTAILKKLNIDTVGRYFRMKTHPEWAITKAEANELSNAGIRIFTIFEDYGYASKLNLTVDQGKRDAQSALNQAMDIGQPKGSTIYFAAEGLPDGYRKVDLPKITDYFSGIVSVLSGDYDIGIYGDGVVCQALLDAGICRYTWLAAASTKFPGTNAFMSSWRWSLAQLGPLDIDVEGLSLDINVANGDFGAFNVSALRSRVQITTKKSRKPKRRK